MSSTAVETTQDGRLADPAASPATDPRIDPRLRAALAGLGMDGQAASSELARPYAAPALLDHAAASDAAFNGLYAVLPLALPGDAEVPFTTRDVPRGDGSSIALRIYRTDDARGPLPAVVYLHGGGMTILDTNAPVHHRWCQDLAAAGLVVVSVDYRNAWTAEGHHPFPAGLSDCVAAVAWIAEQRDELGISRLVVQGESGGANLTLATSLQLARDGLIGGVDGVYANVPYISGGYGWGRDRKATELPSLLENDGFFLNCSMMDLLVDVYDPAGADAENPLCWPYFVTADELRGMPPHTIVVNELDPLRDEGIAYYRKLVQAGVPTVGRVNLGLTHAAELIFRQALPDVHRAAVCSVRDFARGL